jgi:hypothetical protein
VEGAGNSNQLQQYGLNDPNKRDPKSTIVYMLEQVDFNGTVARFYASMKTAGIERRLVDLFPNPVDQVFYLNLSPEIEDWSLKIINSRGQVVRTKSSRDYNGLRYVPISVHELASGIYTVLTETNGISIRHTIAKQ